MRERSARSECSYGKLSPYGFIEYLNSSHGVLVGMVIKRSGPVVHTNHLCGPELYRERCLSYKSGKNNGIKACNRPGPYTLNNVKVNGHVSSRVKIQEKLLRNKTTPYIKGLHLFLLEKWIEISILNNDPRFESVEVFWNVHSLSKQPFS